MLEAWSAHEGTSTDAGEAQFVKDLINPREGLVESLGHSSTTFPDALLLESIACSNLRERLNRTFFQIHRWTGLTGRRTRNVRHSCAEGRRNVTRRYSAVRQRPQENGGTWDGWSGPKMRARSSGR